MAISLLSNLSYLGEDYNFSRDAFATIAEMKAFDADYLPPMYLSYCEEDGKVYLYNDNNTDDATTGKWRVFGEGGGDEVFVGDAQPTDSEIELWLDTSEAYDPDYFAKDDVVSISPIQPTSDSNKVWIDITSAKGVLKYKYGDTYKVIGGVSKLSELTDVDLTSIANNSIIKWNGTKWVATTIANEIIDDTTSAENKVYSSSKVDEIIDGLTLKVDEKPTYSSATGLITYKIGGVSNTTANTNIKFYYTLGANNAIKKYETFFLDGVEYTHLLVNVPSTGGTAEETTYTNTYFEDIENVKQALDKLYAKIYYVPLEVTTFTITPSTIIYEKGSSVSNVSVTCGFNKNITYMEVFENNVKMRDYDYGKTFQYNSPEISSHHEVKFVATDGETEVTKTATISFQNKIYWGSGATVDNYNSSFILALANKKFATSKAGSLSFNVAENEYGFLAMPSSFGAPVCTINGFETDLEDLGTIVFTNASGYTENYKLYKTTQDSLGAFTATIK